MMAGGRIAALAAVLLLLVGCSTGGAGASPTPTTAASQAGAVTVGTATGALGTYLVSGKALYVFTPDGQNTSSCSGQCATNWPPLTVAAGQTPSAGAGVTAQLATFARADGTLQVSANGHPLYFFAGDSAAGDTKGQGLGGNWFLAAPDGSQLAAAGSASPPASATPGKTDDGDDYY